MGYEVYITRKSNHFDEHGPEILLQEWIDYVSNDPEFRLDGSRHFRRDRTVINIDVKAEQGVGVIVVRRDRGEEISLSAIAHNLEPLSESGDEGPS